MNFYFAKKDNMSHYYVLKDYLQAIVSYHNFAQPKINDKIMEIKNH